MMMKKLIFLSSQNSKNSKKSKFSRYHSDRCKKLIDKSSEFLVDVVFISILISAFFFSEKNFELGSISLSPVILVLLHNQLLKSGKTIYTFVTSIALLGIFLFLQTCVVNNLLMRSQTNLRFAFGCLLGGAVVIILKSCAFIVLGFAMILLAFCLFLALFFSTELQQADNLMTSILYLVFGVSYAYNLRLHYLSHLKKERHTSENTQKNIYHLITEYFDSNATLIVSNRKVAQNLDSSIRHINRLVTEEGALLGNNMTSLPAVDPEYYLSYQSQSSYTNFNLHSFPDLVKFLKELKVVSSNEIKWTGGNTTSSNNMIFGSSTLQVSENQKKSSTPVALTELIAFLMESSNTRFIVPDYFSGRSTGILIDEPILISELRYEYACLSKSKKKYFIKAFTISHHSSLRVVVNITDISSQVLNTRLQALDKHKDQILAMVTHDLRNPLSVIKNNLEFIQSEVSSLQHPEEVLRNIKNSFINCKLLETLISDILDYGQIKNGKMKMILENFKAIEVIEELWFMFSSQFLSKNRIAFTIKYDNQLPATIYSDRERLKQVIINLLSNALKFTSEGQVTLTFTLKKVRIKESSVEELIRISVTDTGSGIADGIIPLLFKPYSTFGNEEEHNQKGIGLGLLICKKLVSRLGPFNKIFVQSKENEGSTFWFYIYLKNEGEQGWDNFGQVPRESSQESIEDRNAILKMFGIRANLMAEDQNEIILDSIKLEEDGLVECDEVDEEQHLPVEGAIMSERDKVISRDTKNSTSAFLIYSNKVEDSVSQQSDILEKNNEEKRLRRSCSLSFSNRRLGPQLLQNPINEIRMCEEIPDSPKLVLATNKSKIKIFVCDDNDFNIDIYIKQLKSLNLHIEKFYNGKKLLESLMREESDSALRPSLILLDLSMPIMDGFEASRQIRTLKGMETIPIIGITAYNDGQISEKAAGAGMNEVLYRPVGQQKFVETISKNLGLKTY